VDVGGAAHVAGTTSSSNFPTTSDAYDTSFNGANDAFVSKLTSSGSSLIYSTFLGGGGDDCSYTMCAIAVGSTGAAYVIGITSSSNFPMTAGAFDTTFNGGNADVFITKIYPGGDALAYSTFLGGTGGDYGYSIAVDGSGSAYVTGATWSTGFPTTPGAFKKTFVGCTAFVTKLNTTGSGLVYSTFLGDSSQGFSIAVDSSGTAYATGQTFSAAFPTTSDAFDKTYNGGVGDAFVVKLNASGNGLIYSTFLGGSGTDCEIGGDSKECYIAINPTGMAYITGGTSSSSTFPTTPGAFDTIYNGSYDAFIVKLAMGGSAPALFNKTSPANSATDQPLDPTLTWVSRSGATSYEYCYDTVKDTKCNTSWVDNGISTRVALSGLGYGTTYYWQVRAINSFGTTYANGGAWWRFTTGSLPGAFNKSSPANGDLIPDRRVTIKWNASSGAARYEICYDSTNNDTCDGSWISALKNTRKIISGLSSATTYYWQVRAINGFGTIYANGGAWWSFTTAP
jgi:hypothetical protein